MKIFSNLILTCLLVCFAVSGVNAQSNAWLAKAGIGYSSMLTTSEKNFSIENDPGGRLSFQMGIALKHSLSERFGLQAELLYHRKGATFNNDSIILNFNSLGMAALFLYKPLPKLEFETGLMPSFAFSLKNKEGKDLSKVFDKWQYDWSLLLGMRYMISEKIALNPRVSWGLKPVVTNITFIDYTSTSPTTIENRWNHYSAILSLEYTLGN